MSVNKHEMQIINDAFDMSRTDAIDELCRLASDLPQMMIDTVPQPQKDRFVRAIKVGVNSLKAERTGHWIKSNPLMLSECSECGNKAFGHHGFDEVLTDFCPNCGADMRGEE